MTDRLGVLPLKTDRLGVPPLKTDRLGIKGHHHKKKKKKKKKKKINQERNYSSSSSSRNPNEIEKDGEVELHKSKRQLEQKDDEISEKNSNIKSYLDKILKLTNASSDLEAEMSAKLVEVEENYNESSSSLN